MPFSLVMQANTHAKQQSLPFDHATLLGLLHPTQSEPEQAMLQLKQRPPCLLFRFVWMVPSFILWLLPGATLR